MKINAKLTESNHSNEDLMKRLTKMETKLQEALSEKEKWRTEYEASLKELIRFKFTK